MEFSQQWTILTGAFGLCVTAIGSIWGTTSWIERRFGRAREERITQISELAAELTKGIVDASNIARKYSDDHRRATDQMLADMIQESRTFQMNIYKDFVREKSLLDVESRIMAALGKMEAQIDRIAAQRDHP